MPVPSSINDLSTTPGSNSPSGSESPAAFDDYMRTLSAFIAQLRDGKLDSSSGVALTGDQTIAGIKSFSSAPVVPNASFALTKLANIATARFLGRLTAGSGAPEELTGTQVESLLPVGQTRIDVASATTVNLTSSAPNTDHINITGTTTITGFTVAVGRLYFVRFNAALTLTNGGSLVTQSGANIVTAAGDTCILRATAANVVEVLGYTRGIPQALGEGQTTQGLTGSRALNTTYTNSTGRTIWVSVSAIGSSNADTFIQFLVNGSQVARSSVTYQDAGLWRYIYNTLSAPVLAGQTYRVDTSGGSATLTLWTEVRS